MGHAKKIQTRSQERLDFWTIHLKSPTAALAKALKGLEQGERVPVQALWPFCLWYDGTSSDAEDGLFSSDEEGEHNVKSFMLCSFAHQACSPLLQGFLHEEELCKAALACHFSLDVFLCHD